MRPDTILLPEYHTYIWPGGETETHLMGRTERWHRLRYHRPGAHNTSIDVYSPRGSSAANRVTIREYSDEDEDDEVTIIKEEDSDEYENDELAIIKGEDSDEGEDDKVTIIITDDEESDEDENDEAANIKEEDEDEDEGDISFNTNEENYCSQNTVAISEQFDPGSTGSESAHHISKEGGAALCSLNESLSLRDVTSRKRGRSQDLEPELRECKVRRIRNSSV
ncbi:hypothetical protein TARUN_6146 [Trichoderma arundinaceum]|uniref:Uncharacterized protein n=1 Tax=Trichoderma arundinaceum TaxID=490622 RepID=A0A395NJX6_TRIAR|nr:hypothetical protein TARUN_6146 [Trichoderma arundinaceum]